MADVFKTKSHMLPDVYPPADIRSDTKARRAWLAAKATELASDDIAVKVIGAGSYQHLSVRRLEKVPARIQYRGVCQCCCGSVAVSPDTGLASLHGYERPGNGYIVGRCWGAEEKPANVDLTLTHKFRAKALADAEGYERAAEQFAGEYRQAMTALPAEWWKSDAGKAQMDATRALDEKSQAARSQAWHAREFVKNLDTYAIPAHGQPLAEILIADGAR